MPLSLSQETFLRDFSKACLVWESSTDETYKRRLSVISLAQAILETGWGTSRLSLPPIYNFGGIKHHIPGTPAYNAKTREVLQGKDAIIEGSFQTYPSIAAFLMDHAAELLRWRCVRAALPGSLTTLCATLGPWTAADWTAVGAGDNDASEHANYSTDPTYGETLMLLIEEFALYKDGQLDVYATWKA